MPSAYPIEHTAGASLKCLRCRHRRFLTLAVAGSRHDQNRCGGAHSQIDSLRQLSEVKVNAHGHALGQTDPLKLLGSSLRLTFTKFYQKSNVDLTLILTLIYFFFSRNVLSSRSLQVLNFGYWNLFVICVLLFVI
jgi:hypothetical protein